MSIQTQGERGVTDRFVLASGAGLRIMSEMISCARQVLARRILERAYRNAEKKLMALDDRMLRDIGLSRSEITSAVRHLEQQ